MRIFSWNVNGLRSVIRKQAFSAFLNQENPDLLCLQEIKAKPGQAEIDLPEFKELWHSADRPGYSGTAIFSKLSPLNYYQNFPKKFIENLPNLEDQYGDPLKEGRVQIAEYSKFFLVNVYTPNSKAQLERLKLRHQLWDTSFKELLFRLDQHKPVIACGDFNAAHTEIDLARPKTNTKNAGFTQEERHGITNIIQSGFIDTFRNLHPTEQRYTWWSNIGGARARNIGWRIDYFFISKRLLPHLKSAEIHENILGSDHCPISIELEF